MTSQMLLIVLSNPCSAQPADAAHQRWSDDFEVRHLWHSSSCSGGLPAAAHRRRSLRRLGRVLTKWLFTQAAEGRGRVWYSARLGCHNLRHLGRDCHPRRPRRARIRRVPRGAERAPTVPERAVESAHVARQRTVQVPLSDVLSRAQFRGLRISIRSSNYEICMGDSTQTGRPHHRLVLTLAFGSVHLLSEAVMCAAVYI